MKPAKIVGAITLCVVVIACVVVLLTTNSESVGCEDGRASLGNRLGRAVTAAEVELKNRRYAANNNSGSGPVDQIHWVDHTDRSPIVIVAPHAVNHYRNGSPKRADLYTGPIAEIVAQRIGSSVLTTTGHVSDWKEDWSTRDDAFTRVLDNLPKDAIIVDVHGMDDGSTEHKIAIGTSKSHSEETKTLADRVSSAFCGDAEMNGVFSARSSYTVTHYMQKRGHTAIQIEISNSLRRPSALNVGYTIDALTSALENYH